MEFFLPIKPPTVTHQEKKVNVRNGKPIFYEDSKLKDARSLLTDWLAKFKPGNKFKGSLFLKVIWCFYNKDEKLDGTFKITKPDTDNLQKLLKDCMTVAGYWHDDSQVVCEYVEKRWSVIPGIFIKIQEVSDDK